MIEMLNVESIRLGPAGAVAVDSLLDAPCADSRSKARRGVPPLPQAEFIDLSVARGQERALRHAGLEEYLSCDAQRPRCVEGILSFLVPTMTCPV